MKLIRGILLTVASLALLPLLAASQSSGAHQPLSVANPNILHPDVGSGYW